MEKGRGMIAGPTEDLIAQGQVERVFSRDGITFDPRRL
jgi:hypothetical protein